MTDRLTGRHPLSGNLQPSIHLSVCSPQARGVDAISVPSIRRLSRHTIWPDRWNSILWRCRTQTSSRASKLLSVNLGRVSGTIRDLGLASGFVYERPNGVWECRQGNSKDSVAASVVFRRSCFDQIGGYTPLYYGGSDWLIQLDAKMAGWEILTRPDLHIHHYRLTSSAGGIWRGKFRAGMMDASFGSHPIFELLKCCRRATRRPFVLGSIVRFSGYIWWRLAGRKPLIAREKVAFLKKSKRPSCEDGCGLLM